MGGFKFAARALLELGKELISSDEVALYELIKNSVDAGSPRVDVTAEIVITYNAYRAVLEAIDNCIALDSIMQLISESIVIGTDPERRERFMEPLVRSKTHARLRSALKSAYRRYNWIEVRDTGTGMSLATLSDVYLTVGTRSRREKNLTGAKYLGDKGVGRLSAMRLGDRLMVTTSADGDHHYNVLKINWELFSHDTDVSAGDIDIQPFEGSKKADPHEHGTTIRISLLTANWDAARFSRLLHGPIARMVDPFEAGKGNKLLRVMHNGVRQLVPSIPKKLLDNAHCITHVRFRFDEQTGDPILEGEIDYKLRNKKRIVAQRGAEIYSLAQTSTKRRGKRGDAAFDTTSLRLGVLKELGPFEVDVYWYNRAVVEAVAGLTNTKQETRDEIREWAGGPMLYRHNFRILPYGNPDDDWIELDKNAFGTSGFKLNRQQVMGRVRVNSPHTVLSEQTNREGLVDSEPASALRTIVWWILQTEMRSLINAADKDERLTQREGERLALEFRDTERLVKDTLGSLRKKVEAANKGLVDQLGKQISQLTDQCEKLVGETSTMVEEVKDEREKFVHLAGIGLMTEFIFHELDRAVDHTMKVLAHAQTAKSGAALRSLETQLITLQKRISAFDSLAGERRQTKSSFNLIDVISMVLESHENQFNRHGIAVIFNKPRGNFPVKAVRGMVVQILENLISNAVYWLKQQKKYGAKFKPHITIDVDPESESVTISDNGPGVDARRREVIFEPFITSKAAGQGRGLGLYIARELAIYHGWQLFLDKKVGVERPGRLSLFVLDMGGSR